MIKVDESKVVYKSSSQPAEEGGIPKTTTNENGEDIDSNNCSSNEEDDEYIANSGERFEIIFDKDLFEAPAIVRQNHDKLEAQARVQ